MTSLGLTAVSLDAESVKEATDLGIDLYKQVAECHYSVVIVSPERLTSREFDGVLRNETFMKNIALYFVDEAHLVVPWSLEFRLAFGQIPRVILRIPLGTPTALVTATSRPGPNEDELLKMFGFQSVEELERACKT